MRLALGSTYLGDGRCQFVVWAPLAKKVEVHLVGLHSSESYVPMEQRAQGYHQAIVGGVEPGDLYFYRLNGEKERPDPASRFQPKGVHGPSHVANPRFGWRDHCWFGLPLEDYIIYELHIGTFTPEGTFDAIIPQLSHLKDLGITAIELMPVAQFPGNRNWGYDGVYHFAVQDSYGGPEALKRLVDACHLENLAVVLDVVYNHLGPEGNYLREFGPYFTDHYRTPWGEAVNFDGPDSDGVRRFFIENAIYWVTEFRLDALRLDAVHAILDHTAQPFLHDLAEAVHQQAKHLNRRIYLIPETSLNDTHLIQPSELGGYGLDAQWNDDFHHSLHTLLTGERAGYYQDFGRLDHLVKALSQGYVYTGQYSPYRQRRHGNSSLGVPAHKFVVCAQNHDQVGNRRQSERLSQLVSFEGLKLAAGVVLLSPYIPLLFMGEEYGEIAPFPYFISHTDPILVEAVRRGRMQEFTAFDWQGEIPDPQAEPTFERAKLNHNLRLEGSHRLLLGFYKELIRLRKTSSALALLSKEHLEVRGFEKEKVLFVRRWSDNEEIFMGFNFSDTPISLELPVPAGSWHNEMDSANERWQARSGSLGPLSRSYVPVKLVSEGGAILNLSPKAFALFTRIVEAE
jgi:maltooligosyltrehalose trehalohydrolase